MVVAGGDGLEQELAVLGSLLDHVGRNVDLVPLGAELLVVPDERLHLDEIDQPDERLVALRATCADRQMDDRWRGLEAILDHVNGAVEVGADAIHLVDEAHPRHLVLVGLTPHRLGLRLDAGDRVEHGDSTVENAQRTLDLDGEVDVAGSVDDVDAVVVPDARRGSRGDGDAPLLLLRHVVHGRGAVVHLADLVALPGVVEDALGRGGLARVDVGHDADVAGALEWVFALSHLSTSLSACCSLGVSVRRGARKANLARGTVFNDIGALSAFARTPSLCQRYVWRPCAMTNTAVTTASASPRWSRSKQVNADELLDAALERTAATDYADRRRGLRADRSCPPIDRRRTSRRPVHRRSLPDQGSRLRGGRLSLVDGLRPVSRPPIRRSTPSCSPGWSALDWSPSPARPAPSSVSDRPPRGRRTAGRPGIRGTSTTSPAGRRPAPAQRWQPESCRSPTAATEVALCASPPRRAACSGSSRPVPACPTGRPPARAGPAWRSTDS